MRREWDAGRSCHRLRVDAETETVFLQVLNSVTGLMIVVSCNAEEDKVGRNMVLAELSRSSADDRARQ